MTKKFNEMGFEEAVKRLEKILEKMNSGNISLDDSLKMFEEANALITSCNKRLASAEQKVEKLIKSRQGDLALDSSGNPQTEPL
ncbi:MAG: Exodeoxyribonuclease 7 small subunit [Chlamydiae bacterium]|nr:Exodeoxyribonuclease 7 small subunit [Chlamydiota bacterium]